jgi:glutathione S-transferase
MSIQLFGHPWSVNTRKVLAAAAEKGHTVPLTVVMLPKGEHRRPEHLRRHPFGKVPALEADGFVLYESRAIAAYLDATLSGPALTPSDARSRARMDQWISAADSYFVPLAGPMIVELLFRRYLGGETNQAAVAAGRAGLAGPLDVLDRAVANAPFLAGDALSLADLCWLPYLEYLDKLGEAPLASRPHAAAWWRRVSERPAWQTVARTGPQPYDPAMTADVIENQVR